MKNVVASVPFDFVVELTELSLSATVKVDSEAMLPPIYFLKNYDSSSTVIYSFTFFFVTGATMTSE